MKKPIPLVILPATEFVLASMGFRYVFPIARVNEPGVGRLEASIEPVVSRHRIKRLLVWFSSTKIERYQGKLFGIDCPDSRLIATSGNGADFLRTVWSVGPCRDHGGIILSGHAPDGTRALVVDALTIGASIYWKTAPEEERGDNENEVEFLD